MSVSYDYVKQAEPNEKPTKTSYDEEAGASREACNVNELLYEEPETE